MASPSLLAAVRARLSLPHVRRAAKALEGVHPTNTAQRGFDFDRIVPYEPGQDASTIDWAATARAGEPMARRFIGHTSAPVVLVADTGRHMAAIAPSGEPKFRIACEAAEVLAFLATVRSDPLGVILGDAGRERFLAPRAGNAHAEVVLRALADAYSPLAPEQHLSGLLDRVDQLVRRPSLLVVLTDVPQAGAAAQALRRVQMRHSVYVLMVEDTDPAGLLERDVADMTLGPLDAYLLANREVTKAVRARVVCERATTRAVLDDLAIAYRDVESSEGVVDTLESLFRGQR